MEETKMIWLNFKKSLLEKSLYKSQNRAMKYREWLRKEKKWQRTVKRKIEKLYDEMYGFT